MRLIHTGDWHLGRYLHGVSLVEDQAWWLERFVALVDDARPDAIIIAGDVYDRAVPPAEAVALLDDVLARIVTDLGVPVLMVAGNHDGPERVGFGARVLDGAGLHVAGVLGGEVRSAVVGEGDEAARVWLLPYADPIETRAALEEADIRDHQDAVAACVARIRAAGATERYQVLVAHHFVAGGLTSESERGLSVGGTGAVGADVFGGLDYVALGHLHRRQTLGDGRIHYPGSALKYAFDETSSPKSVSLVELADGAVTIEHVELGARRDVRRVQGTYAAVLEAAASDAARDDYIEVVLDERAVPPDAHGRLRESYPNLLRLGRALEFGDVDGDPEAALAVRSQSMSDEERYERFYQYVTGEELDDATRDTLHALIAKWGGGESR